VTDRGSRENLLLTGPVEAARKFIEAWQQGDLETMLSICHLSRQSRWAKRLFVERFGREEVVKFTYLETPVNLHERVVTSWGIRTRQSNERIHISSVRAFQDIASDGTAERIEWVVNPTSIVRDTVSRS
jgi:hypothetical protein